MYGSIAYLATMCRFGSVMGAHAAAYVDSVVVDPLPGVPPGASNGPIENRDDSIVEQADTASSLVNEGATEAVSSVRTSHSTVHAAAEAVFEARARVANAAEQVWQLSNLVNSTNVAIAIAVAEQTQMQASKDVAQQAYHDARVNNTRAFQASIVSTHRGSNDSASGVSRGRAFGFSQGNLDEARRTVLMTKEALDAAKTDLAHARGTVSKLLKNAFKMNATQEAVNQRFHEERHTYSSYKTALANITQAEAEAAAEEAREKFAQQVHEADDGANAASSK